MVYPVSFWLDLLAAFVLGFASVTWAVRAIRSQGRIRRLNTLASVSSMLACSAVIALSVWLWVIPHQ
jgi:hypothetical protein